MAGKAFLRGCLSGLSPFTKKLFELNLGTVGFDAGKLVKGRKHLVLIDTLGNG